MSHIGQTHSVYFRAYVEIQQELHEMFAMSSHTGSFDRKPFHLQKISYILVRWIPLLLVLIITPR